MKLILSKIKTYFGKLDKLLLFMCIGIAGFAVFIQYTLYENDISSAVTATQYKTQLIAFIGGLVIALVLAVINYKFIAKLWFIYVPIGLGLTLLLFTPLGIQREGADDIGWLDLGIMTIQPSEILKLAFILSLAFHLSKVEDRMNEPMHFILLCVHGAIPTLLIRQTGDDGSAIVFLFIFLCMMFAAGLSWKYLVMIAVAIPPAVYVLWNYLMQPHQQKRFQVLWDTQMQEDEALGIYMQQRVGKIALGSGGLTGQGTFGRRIYLCSRNTQRLYFFIYRNDNGTARLSAYCRNACGAVTENSLQCKRCKGYARQAYLHRRICSYCVPYNSKYRNGARRCAGYRNTASVLQCGRYIGYMSFRGDRTGTERKLS